MMVLSFCLQNFIIGAFKPACHISVSFSDGKSRKQVHLLSRFYNFFIGGHWLYIQMGGIYNMQASVFVHLCSWFFLMEIICKISVLCMEYMVCTKAIWGIGAWICACGEQGWVGGKGLLFSQTFVSYLFSNLLLYCLLPWLFCWQWIL